MTTNQKMIAAAKAAIADFRDLIADVETIPFDWEPDWIDQQGRRFPWWEVPRALAEGIDLVPAREIVAYEPEDLGL